MGLVFLVKGRKQLSVSCNFGRSETQSSHCRHHQIMKLIMASQIKADQWFWFLYLQNSYCRWDAGT